VLIYIYIYLFIGVYVTEIPYRLNGPVLKPRWGEETCSSPYPYRPTLESIKPPPQQASGAFPKVKRPGRGLDHPPLFNAEVTSEKR